MFIRNSLESINRMQLLNIAPLEQYIEQYIEHTDNHYSVYYLIL